MRVSLRESARNYIIRTGYFLLSPRFLTFASMKSLTIAGRLLAVLTIILGGVHEVMTFQPMIADGLKGLSEEWRQTFTYFSLGCGGMLLLSGFLFLMLLGRVERPEFLAAPLVAIGVFATANGLLAVGFMLRNPFAWTGLALGVGLLVVALMIREEHKKR